MTGKYELGTMTWAEAKEANLPEKVVLLPIGTTEQNGPACPLSIDTYISNYFAVEVARRTGSIAMPAIPYGCSAAFGGFAGTIWLEPSTLEAVVRDVARACARHGVKRFVAVNNHGPNQAAVETALRQVMRETGMKTIGVWPGEITRKLAEEELKAHPEVLGHGGEPMTSLIMAIAPHTVRKDLAAESPQKHSAIGRFVVRNSVQSTFEGHPVRLYLDVDQVSKTGQTGDPRGASAEFGQRLLDHLVAWGVDLVEELKRVW
ncbi:MAG: creatininase family protein [Bacillota bacterium]